MELLLDPLKDYEKTYRHKHAEICETYFQQLVERSQVNVEENRRTVTEHASCAVEKDMLSSKLNWLRFFRVLMCISLVLIPLVILKMTPAIRKLRAEVQSLEERERALYQKAAEQMLPLNSLFSHEDALRIMEETLPFMDFAPCFSIEQEEDMKQNYDFGGEDDEEESTVDLLAGRYNGNPFLFESRLTHTMGTEIYHGYRTIYWTETYRDSNGRTATRTRSQTLHATVTMPKPYYHTKVLLHYGAQGAPDLCFSRDAGHLDQKSEKEIDKLVKKGEKKLKKLSDKALKNNEDFVSMSNTDFEVLFDALDRTDEVQFRSLFTPLAQTNLVSLIRSQEGFGDDFHFVKRRRSNRILTEHSQGRPLYLYPQEYQSHSFDGIKEQFLTKNAAHFKAVYFDFAPLWAIPAYQERPVHSLKPLPNYAARYSQRECEALANGAELAHVAHPDSKTRAILKSAFVSSRNGVDKTVITAYSYDIAKRVTLVPVLGGDGRLHNVPVDWDEYLPLVAKNEFLVYEDESNDSSALARRNRLSIFHS